MVLHEKYAKEPWRHIGLKVPNIFFGDLAPVPIVWMRSHMKTAMHFDGTSTCVKTRTHLSQP